MKRFALPAMLVLVAAIGVSSAAASQFQLAAYPKSIKNEPTAKGTNERTFTTNDGTIKCDHTSFEGELKAASPTLVGRPDFYECRRAGIAAPFHGHFCQFALNVGGEPKGEIYGGFLSILTSPGCESSGNVMTMERAGCNWNVPLQTAKAAVSYQNKEERVVVTYAVTGLTYTLSGSGCSTAPGTYVNGTMSGTEKLAVNGGAPGFFVK